MAGGLENGGTGQVLSWRELEQSPASLVSVHGGRFPAGGLVCDRFRLCYTRSAAGVQKAGGRGRGKGGGKGGGNTLTSFCPRRAAEGRGEQLNTLFVRGGAGREEGGVKSGGAWRTGQSHLNSDATVAGEGHPQGVPLRDG